MFAIYRKKYRHVKCAARLWQSMATLGGAGEMVMLLRLSFFRRVAFGAHTEKSFHSVPRIDGGVIAILVRVAVCHCRI